jgi:TetR/AcrR family transcriptional regulator, fatty acid biosynthesis regulator
MALRASPEQREEKERTRKSLLDAALALGVRHGFASLGLREVARAAAIAPTSFYRHFADMGELGFALVHERVRPVIRELATRAVAGDASGMRTRLVDAVLVAIDREPEVVRFLLSERVGAFERLRQGLAEELEVLATAIATTLLASGQSASRGPGQARANLAAQVALAVLLDGFTRILDGDPERRGEQRRTLVAALGWALAGSRKE